MYCCYGFGVEGGGFELTEGGFPVGGWGGAERVSESAAPSDAELRENLL